MHTSISLQASSESAATLGTCSSSLEPKLLSINQDVADFCDRDLRNHWTKISIKNIRNKAIAHLRWADERVHFMKEIDSEDDLAGILRVSRRVFVLFYASWCPFCIRFLPIFEEYSQKSSQEFLRVRIDDEMNPLWEKYEVMVVPTVVLFEDGSVKRRLDGLLGSGLSEEQLRSFLENA